MNLLHITEGGFPVDEKFRGNEVFLSNIIQNSKFNHKIFSLNKKYSNINNLDSVIETNIDNINNYDSIMFHDFSRKYFKKVLESNYNGNIYFFLHCMNELYPFSQKESHKLNNAILNKLISEKNLKMISVSRAAKNSFEKNLNKQGIKNNSEIEVLYGFADSNIYSPKNRLQPNFINADYVVGFSGRPNQIKGSKTLLMVINEFEKNNPNNVGFYLSLTGSEKLKQSFLENLIQTSPNLILDDKIKISLDLAKLNNYQKDLSLTKYELFKNSIGEELFYHQTNIGFTNTAMQNQLDIYFHPSNSEAFGLSILEAIMSGVHVITSNVGGIKEFVNHNNGYLVDISKDTKDNYKSYDLRKSSNYSDVMKFYNLINEALLERKDPYKVNNSVSYLNSKNFIEKFDEIIS
jgi:glycosyltransferase involved in cell wall biosynthesis